MLETLSTRELKRASGFRRERWKDVDKCRCLQVHTTFLLDNLRDLNMMLARDVHGKC
jgi:hypothetical protein